MKAKMSAVLCSLGLTMGTGALLLLVSGVSAQNLFIGDQGSHSIIEIPTNGQQSTIATDLVYPNAAAFDHDGNLYVADQYAGNIFVCPHGGGSPILFATELNNPMSLAFNRKGDLFVGTQDSNILKYAPGRRVPTVFATGLNLPDALAFNSKGDLFVADLADDVPGAGYVTEIKPNGKQTLFASGFTTPDGLAFNATGDLFVSSGNAGIITEISPGGTSIIFAPGLNAPIGLAFDSKGNLFVADGGFNNESGDVTEFFAKGGENVITLIIKPLSLAFQGVALPVRESPVPASSEISESASQLVVTPVPRITGIHLSGATLTITATSGAPGEPYVLLESTNLLLPLDQWRPLLTNSFDGSGNLNLSTNVVNPNIPQEFYRLQMPK
jgi:sugar lactone lactonase YvrE